MKMFAATLLLVSAATSALAFNPTTYTDGQRTLIITPRVLKYRGEVIKIKENKNTGCRRAYDGINKAGHPVHACVQTQGSLQLTWNGEEKDFRIFEGYDDWKRAN